MRLIRYRHEDENPPCDWCRPDISEAEVNRLDALLEPMANALVVTVFAHMAADVAHGR